MTAWRSFAGFNWTLIAVLLAWQHEDGVMVLAVGLSTLMWVRAVVVRDDA